MTTRLRIRFFGPLQVTLDGEPVTQFGSDTARALLAYLALHPGVPHRRDALAGLLWPEHTDTRARHNLRAALSRLRTALQDREADPPLLNVERQTIEFSSNAHSVVDVLTTRDALAATQAHAHERMEDCAECAEQLREAVDLYRGELLAGFSLDSAPFEEWMVVEREGLHWQALEALSALGAYHERQGEYEAAIACARRQVELEPWRESAHRQWMRCLAASGHRAAALAQYETCKQILEEELGVEPEPDTQALYERIRSGALAPRPSVPPARAPQPASIPKAGPGPDVAEPEDERRVVTALSVGFVGQTAAGDPELWAEEVAHALRQAASIVARYGGEVSQVRGDGLAALFGAAVAHEDDPQRAVLAALSLAQAIRESTPDLALSSRAGVYTGEAVVSQIGSGARPTSLAAVAALGNVLPAAGQLERAAELETVLVDEQTYRLTEPFFKWQVVGDRAYRPLARASALDALRGKGRGIAGLDSPLIGRDAEVHALQGALDNLHAGTGGIVTVVGEAGIGKSRLVAETRKLVPNAGNPSPNPKSATDLRSDLKWIEGRCLSYTTTVAYQLWLSVLRGLLGVEIEIEGAVSEDAACVNLREEVRALCGERVDDVHPYLARLTCPSLDEETEARLRGVDAEGLRYLTFRAWETVIECATRVKGQRTITRPLVLVCEDLHWADPTSLALLEHLLPLTERIPLLFVCVLRPLTDHGCWHVREVAARDYRHRHTDLWLEALTERESVELVGHLLRIEDLPEALRTRIVAHADGNPFYVEEILRSLIDGGVLAHDEAAGRWRATRDPGELPLPDTLRGVLMARVDRLPVAARHVLQLASVVGRFFERRTLEALTPSAPELDDDLRLLQGAQMIRRRAQAPEAVYVFKHQLTQEAAYESLLRRKRRALHRRVAQALEQLYPERIEEQLGTLARHWERAGDAERAIVYLRRAGEQAAERFANAEAIDYASRALDLTPEEDLEGRYALTNARESALDLLGRRDEQQVDLVALEALAERLADPGLQADVALRRAHFGIRTYDLEAAEDAARAALNWSEMAQDVGRQAAAHCQLGRALRYHDFAAGSKDAARVRSELELALRLARTAASKALEVDVLHELASVCADHSLALAQSLWEEQLRICREAGYRRVEGRALRDVGVAHAQQDRYEQAKCYFEQSLDACRQTGHRREEGWALQYLGFVHALLGNYGAARAYSEQALRVHQETADRYAEMQAYQDLIRSAAHTDDYDGVRAWIVRAEQQVDNLNWAIYAGDLAWQRGERESVRAQYLELTQARDDKGFRAHLARCGLASIALAEGDRAEAACWIAPVLSLLGQPIWWSPLVGLYPHLVCYRVLQAGGDPRASEVLEQAYRLLQERASWIEDEALRRLYLENVPANREIAALYEQAT